MYSRILRGNVFRIEGERAETLKITQGRLILVSAFFALLFMFTGIRALDVSLIYGGGDRHAASSQGGNSFTRRGDIFDREGVLLATSLKTPSLYADPRLVTEPKTAARQLAQIFPDQDYAEFEKKLSSTKRFVWLKRNITPRQQSAVLQIGEPGLQFKEEYRRIYPQGGLAAHLLGYANVDNKGLAGVERSFNEQLASGQDLTLSIDMRLQHALRREVRAAAADFDARAGAGVILDVQNGEVLAGVSWPDFDPHFAGQASDAARFNRLSLGVYELGSLFKIFSTAAVLEFQNLAFDARFDVREPIKRGRFTINDFHAEERVLSLPEVFMFSSNIGSAYMGEMVGTEALRNFYYDLGLLTRMDWDTGEAGRPLVPDPWRDIHTLTASYGHGIATTPLQMSAAVASIVNGGYLVRPHLIRQENNKNTLRIVSENTAYKMRQLMRLVVSDGTGGKADVPGYRVGGKTGTAEKIGAQGGYDKDRLISSFVGVFPAEDPRYLVLVMIDEPKGNKRSFGYATAGWVAAPPVARVVETIGSILGIPKEHKEDLGAPLKQYVMSREDREMLKREALDVSH